MIGDIRADLHNDSGCRIRSMNALLEQIKGDYAGFKRVWEGFERGRMRDQDGEKVHRILAWIREELRIYKRLSNRSIEGVRCVEIEDIENDVFEKEKIIINENNKY